jgi:hypothetical protein
VLVTLTPVGLFGRVFAKVHPVARTVMGWTFSFSAPTVGEHAFVEQLESTLLNIFFDLDIG